MLDDVERSLTVVGAPYLVATCLESGPEDLDVVLVVIDNEQTFFRVVLRRPFSGHCCGRETAEPPRRPLWARKAWRDNRRTQPRTPSPDRRQGRAQSAL